MKFLGVRGESNHVLVDLQDQVMKLSVALAAARAREGEQLTHLAALSKERETLRTDRASLLALVKGAQVLLEQQNARVAALERSRNQELLAPAKPARSRVNKATRPPARHDHRLRDQAPDPARRPRQGRRNDAVRSRINQRLDLALVTL